jgi:hypothetical protein
VERSLHRQLKERYGLEPGGACEVRLGRYRVDAVDPSGRIIEIQTGPLAPLRAKLAHWLPDREVSIVKPVVLERRIIRRDQPQGTDRSARRSPKRGTLLDVFDQLVGLGSTFPHRNLRVEILGVEIDEIRVPRRRPPGHSVVDRRLRSVVASQRLDHPADLWRLLPATPPDAFTCRTLADLLGRSLDFAQRVAYCLRQSGAVETVGKQGAWRVYRRVDP